jgi:Rrf2 family transcriptional regulator, cysteine metabolism repressor
MRISTRARYGTRAMLDLALHYDGGGTVMVKEVAERQQISPRYLEQLLFTLKLTGMVRSTRGTKGGFSLSKHPSEIKLIDIVEALDGSIAPVGCVDEPDQYARSCYCATHDIWVEVKNAASKVLSSVTLEDLANRQKGKETLATQIGDQAVEAMNSKCRE